MLQRMVILKFVSGCISIFYFDKLNIVILLLYLDDYYERLKCKRIVCKGLECKGLECKEIEFKGIK
jgi:hypothetical protein